ncbi:hypothetical protein V1517DRAFT_324023 [Lipomyces orientalis]|uniref:Uncharacterized protein n=1 Tax=Lipomyces orientalis TaxID=1233043 RepID=A0ACC3TLW4_9ASCO
MADNYAYFLPRSGVYSQPGAIGGDPAYVGASKSVSEIDMDAIFSGQYQNRTATSMAASWNAPGSMPAGQQQHQLSYPESAKVEFAEDAVMFNAPVAAVSSDSQSMSPDSNDGVFVPLPPPQQQQQQQQWSDNGEDEKLNDADDLQSKRKAQNRAAQRAFRERREKHVRELQEKLEQAEKSAKDVEHENARLKKELEWYQAENKNLKEAARVTSVSEFNNGRPTKVVFPELKGGANVEDQQEHQVPQTSADTAFLDPSQIWDRLKEHPRADVIDIHDVMKQLMSKAQCGGHGPIFSITDVDQAIAAASFEL